MRISCAQLFRAAGVDKSSPIILDTMTDILIRHLDLLSKKATRNAALSGRNQVVIQDVALAMEQIGLIRPRVILDPWDTDPQADVGMRDFIDWAEGPIPEEARRISRIPNQNANQKSSSNAAAAAAQANNTNDTTTNTNNSNSNNTNNHNQLSNVTTIDEDDEWLIALMKKQSKLGQEARFNATVLDNDESHIDNETKVVGGGGSNNNSLP